MRNRRPSPEHEQAVARRLALLAAEWDTAKAVGVQETVVRVPGHATGTDEVVPAGGEWPWNPPTRVVGDRSAGDHQPPAVAVVQVLDPGNSPAVDHEDGEDDGDDGDVVEDFGDEPPPLVRVPGRHAARRGSGHVLGGVLGAATARLLSPVAGARTRLSAAHLTWVAVLVAVALGATCWWLVGAKESAVLTPVSATFAGSETDESSSAEQGNEPTTPPDEERAPDGDGAAAPDGERGAAPDGVGEVVVDVAGKVRRPGIVVLPVGSRVVDAIEAAGGTKRGVDVTPLNLARRLLDGEQILVGKAAAPGVGAAPAPGAPSSPSGALVNLNSATQTELETLPGVGPVTASAIVEWRERHGGFTAVEDLLEVDGIGEVTLKRLAPLVSV